MPLTNIDGLTAGVRREDRSVASVIVVNRRDWGERQRFTGAHELGHMILDVAPKIAITRRPLTDLLAATVGGAFDQLFSVLEFDALDDLGEAVRSVETPPLLGCRLAQLADRARPRRKAMCKAN